VTSREHDRLSVFGIVGEEEAPLLRPLVRSLTAHGMLTTTDHGGLALGPAARPVLKGERPVTIAEPPAKKRSRARTQAANPVGDPLFDALRAKRKALASERGVPAYVIFHDSVLRDMARERPETLRELGELQGVGATKLETYGADFIAVIRDSFRA